MKPAVSIFIPAFNDRTDLDECIESLRRLDYPKQRLELVVWDNASSDGTASMIQAKFDAMRAEGWLDLKLLRSERNEGSYMPYNLGYGSLSLETRYILGLDADVVLQPEALTFLVAAIQNTGIAAAGGRSVFYCRPEKTASAAGFVSRWTARYRTVFPDAPVKCDFVIGCCWLLHKEAFQRVGGFDSDFFISQWEIDYCLRLRAAGHSVLCEPRAVARHKIPVHGLFQRKRLYYIFRNKLLMIRKNAYFTHKRSTLVVATCLSLARLASVAFWRASPADLRRALCGLLDGLRGRTGSNPSQSAQD